MSGAGIVVSPAFHETMQRHVKAVAPTGSRAMCVPAPTDTDEDWIVLVDSLQDFGAAAMGDGWTGPAHPRDEEKYPDGFDTFRSGIINLIVTAQEDFYRRFDAATHVGRRLNLLSKDDRIALFQAVLYGNKYDGASK